MEFGVFDHLDRNPSQSLAEFYESRLRLTEAYDRAGFFAYHVAEHHLSPIGMAPSPSVFLAAVAQRTRALRFGAMIYAAPLYHPVRLVEELCMLDQLSGGRLEMGFGRGASSAELRSFGQDPAQAQQAYTDTLAVVLAALRDGRITVPTEHGSRTVPLPIEPFQRPHPPLWYGVHSVESAERAARQGLNVVSLDSPAETRVMADHYRAAWREAHGEEQPSPRIGMGTFVVVAADGQRAMASARHAYRRWHESFYYVSRLYGQQVTHARPPEFDDMLALGRAVAGAPDEVAATLRERLVEAGVDYCVTQLVFGDLSPRESEESVALFARNVMPALREISPGSADGEAPVPPAPATGR